MRPEFLNSVESNQLRAKFNNVAKKARDELHAIQKEQANFELNSFIQENVKDYLDKSYKHVKEFIEDRHSTYLKNWLPRNTHHYINAAILSSLHKATDAFFTTCFLTHKQSVIDTFKKNFVDVEDDQEATIGLLALSNAPIAG